MHVGGVGYVAFTMVHGDLGHHAIVRVSVMNKCEVDAARRIDYLLIRPVLCWSNIPQ